MFKHRLLHILISVTILFPWYIQGNIEDDYHRRYTNKQFVVWNEVRDMKAENKYDLEKLCLVAHHKSGKGRIDNVYGVSMYQGYLKFKESWAFNPVTIDVVTYWYNASPYFITRGLCSNCVFYLREEKNEPTDTYRLVRHVCSVDIDHFEESTSCEYENSEEGTLLIDKIMKCFVVCKS